MNVSETIEQMRSLVRLQNKGESVWDLFLPWGRCMTGIVAGAGG